MAIHDSESNEIETYNDECDWKGEKTGGKGMSSPIVRAIQYIEQAKVIIGHNIINFDIPAIRKLHHWFEPRGLIIDTLLLSRLYHPRIIELDVIKHKNKKELTSRWPHMPGQLIGRHSLEAWGYRLGEYKGNFSKTTDWQEWSKEMEDYCAQDVEVTRKLWNYFHPYLDGSKWNTRSQKSSPNRS